MLPPPPPPPVAPVPSSPFEEQLPQQVQDMDQLLYGGSSTSTTTTGSNNGTINKSNSSPSAQEEDKNATVRRGPWTVDEDRLLVSYIASHGEGRWNSLARSAGLKRTGKSCRLRWLNYLRPEVRRGNITPEEQLLILELHSRWGNRWSRIAEQLPGRTDNEIKNYWRTRVQKHAKQLRCDVDSDQFKDLVRYLWMPRLLERVRSHHPRRRPPQPPAAVDSPPKNNDDNTAAVALSSDSDSNPKQLEEETSPPPPHEISTINEDYKSELAAEAAICWCPESTSQQMIQVDYLHNQTSQIERNVWVGIDSIWSENDVLLWSSHHHDH